MKRVLFRRILISYLIIAPLLLVSLELYLSNIIKENYISKLRNNLIIQSRLISENLTFFPAGGLDDLCKRYKEKTGARVTIMDASGRVVGDSDEPSKMMENHLDRPEINEASLNNIGSSIRFSKTVRRDFFYLAVAMDKRGFLRLAVPLRDMEKEISDTRKRIAIASVVVALIAIFMGILQTGRITKSIEEIVRFSSRIKSGNFKTRLFLKEKGEIGDLAKNINEMAEELKKRLEQSQADRHKMEEILRNMSDGLMLVDTNGKILLCNPAVKRFFGIEPEVEGKTLIETVRNAEFADVLHKAIAGRKSVSQEIKVMYPKESSLMATAVPFYYPSDSENISGAVISLHDITRLKKLEEIRKDFVANVSHEIKTPITAIRGFAETLLEGAVDDRENALKFLRTIKNHSVRLNSLVEDLLTLSRIELGDIKIEETTVNFDDVIDTVFTTLRDKANAKNIYLKKDIPENLNKIKADRNRLVQILLNLVDNGIKFTEKGGITIKVQSSKFKVQSEEKDSEPLTLNRKLAHFIEISVEDTGIGIAKHHLTRLGERFYRVDRSRSRELGGTGLGLAIVKHLVKAHGWDMGIESEPGKGTKVRIILYK
ncbi:MAG: PAS domain S-box protein [Nitrospirae bacterium]|nr:PAS domain S-box protein [Nitrospirota bacterium]